MSALDLTTFKNVVSNTPLVSIDLIIRNANGRVLLGIRANRPAQGFWFVPGGRILKNETFKNAFLRLTKEELGIEIPISSASFLGPFEHLYLDNFSGDDFSTHYVVLCYEVFFDCSIDALPKVQHTHYQWWEPSEILTSESVHKNTKAYFQQ